MPRPKMKRIFASKICRTEFTPERRAMVRNHPAPRRMRRITRMLGSIAAGGAAVLTGVPPGLSDMFAPCITYGVFEHLIIYCYAKLIGQSRRILRCGADIVLPPSPPECGSVGPVVSCCPDGSFGVKLLAKPSLRAESRRVIPGRGRRDSLFLRETIGLRIALIFLWVLCASPPDALAQEQHEDEIVANLAGGRAIVHVAKDVIVFAAIDQPVERNSIPPRVMDLDATHIAVLFGASAWRSAAGRAPRRSTRRKTMRRAPSWKAVFLRMRKVPHWPS